MSILLKNATIVDGKSNLNFKTKDILINDGDIVNLRLFNNKGRGGNSIIVENKNE